MLPRNPIRGRRSPRRVLSAHVEGLEDRTLLATTQGLNPAAVGPQYVPGEVLVQFKPGVPAAAQARGTRVSGSGGRVGRDDRPGAMRAAGDGNMELLHLPAGLSVEASIHALQANPNVEFAEPNWIYTTHATANDPYYTNGSLWGMYGNDARPGRPDRDHEPVRQPGGAGLGGGRHRLEPDLRRGHRRGHPVHPPGPRRQRLDQPLRPAATASTTTATATWTTSTAGTSPTTTTRSTTAARTTTARTSPARSAAQGGNGHGRRGRQLERHLHRRQVPRHARRYHGRRDQGDGLLHRPEGAARSEHRRLEQLVGRRRLFPGPARRDHPRRQGEHPVRRRRRQRRFRRRRRQQRHLGELPVELQHDRRDEHRVGRELRLRDRGGGDRPERATWPASRTTARTRWTSPRRGSASTRRLPTNSYGSYSGTSMATPHVTGAAALYAATYLERNGVLPSADTIKQALLDSAIPTNSLLGKTVTNGRLDVYGAIASISPPTSPPAAPSGLGGTVLSSSQIVPDLDGQQLDRVGVRSPAVGRRDVAVADHRHHVVERDELRGRRPECRHLVSVPGPRGAIPSGPPPTPPRSP